MSKEEKAKLNPEELDAVSGGRREELLASAGQAVKEAERLSLINKKDTLKSVNPTDSLAGEEPLLKASLSKDLSTENNKF